MYRSLLVAVAALCTACGSGPKLHPDAPAPTALPKVSDANVYLRSAMDADPSVYLGRFVADATPAASIDEAGAAKLACSTHFTVRKVDAGGVEFDHVYQASTQAAAGLSIPDAVPISAQVGGSDARMVRIRYELTDKWVADLKDPAAYAECCRRQPDQCSGRVVGEFLGGVGTIYYAASAAGGAGVSVPGAGLEIKDGVAWKQATKFGKRTPVFFAFKLTKTAVGATATDWDTHPPVSQTGHYFVGVSEWINSERMARDQALADARGQVVRFLGERISEDVKLAETLGGDAGNLKATFAQAKTGSRVSAGVAEFVKDERWKPETTQGPDGVRYRAKVLAFIANEQIAKAAAAAAQAVKAKPGS